MYYYLIESHKNNLIRKRIIDQISTEKKCLFFAPWSLDNHLFQGHVVDFIVGTKVVKRSSTNLLHWRFSELPMVMEDVPTFMH